MSIARDASTTLRPNGFSLTGWTFDEWTTNRDGSGTKYSNRASVRNLANVDQTVILYAQWKQNEYTVTYDPNKPSGASGNVTGEIADSTLKYDDATSKLAAAGYSLAGWTFNGWNTRADGTGTNIEPNTEGKHNLTATNGGSVTVYAQWRPNKTTVVFNNNGDYYNGQGSHAVQGSMANLPIDYDSDVALTKCSFTKFGWHFDHWSTASDPNAAGARTFTDEQSVRNLASDEGELVLYAHYARDKFTLTLSPNAPQGSRGTVQNMPGQAFEWFYDSTNPVPSTNPTLKGYTFDKWTYLSSDGEGTQLPTEMAAQNLMLDAFLSDGIYEVPVNANWTALKYYVEYNGNAPAGTVSDLPSSSQFTYDGASNTIAAQAPKRDGYEFDGWSTSDGSGGSNAYAPGQTLAQGVNLVDNPQVIPTSTVTLYAQWKATTTTVTFDSNGGPNAPAAKVATYGSDMPAIGKSELPTRRGYAFEGFYDAADENGNKYYNADGTSYKAWDKTGASARLFAHWKKNSAKVTVSSELDDSTIAHNYYNKKLVEYEPEYETDKSVSVAVGDKAPKFAKVPVAVKERIGEGATERDIDHQLVGWRWSYTGADGKDYSGMLPVVNATGDYDWSYTQVVLYGLPEDAPEGAVIDLKADYETFPFVGAMAVNGTVAMALTNAEYHEATKTIEAKDIGDKTAADVKGAFARFKTNGENWELPDDGVELVDQYGARGKVALSADPQNVTMKADGRTPYDIGVTVSFEENNRNNGALVFNSYPESDNEGVPMTLLVSASYVPVQTTYDFSVMYQQTDGTYKEEGETTKSDPVDAGSEVPLDIKDAKRGYHFSRALYKDDNHSTPQSSSLPVRYNGSTNVIYYYDLDTYTATLSTDPQAATLVDGAAGWRPANDGKTWTRDFTVLDEVTLPTPKADDFKQQFLGWNLSTTAGDGYAETLPAGTVGDVRYVASWRELSVPKPVTGGGETTYDGNEHETPITLPEGYIVDEAGNVFDESGRKIGHLEGDTTNTDAGEHHVKLVYEDGYIGEDGKTEEDLVYNIKPTDVTGKDGKPAATVNVSGADYTGKAQTPKPTVTYEGKTLEEGKDYTVSYSNNTMPGTATMTVTFKGNYAGTIKKTFTIKNTTKQMFRLYNPNSGEHFYTANAGERDNVKAAGWTYEGVGWIAPATGDPVYRLYNEFGGEHHYTMSKGERDSLKRAGWKDEGVGWYSDAGRNVKVLREYNPNQFANNHNYTTSSNEHKTLLGLGWKDEGVAWYAVRAK